MQCFKLKINRVVKLVFSSTVLCEIDFLICAGYPERIAAPVELHHTKSLLVILGLFLCLCVADYISQILASETD